MNIRKIIFDIIIYIIVFGINIADITLTSLGFSDKNLGYFITRFILQFFTIFLSIEMIFFLKLDTCEGIGDGINLMIFSICSGIYLIINIPGLVLFLIYNNDLEFFAKLGYYIHLSYYGIIPLLIIFKNKNLSKYFIDDTYPKPKPISESSTFQTNLSETEI